MQWIFAFRTENCELERMGVDQVVGNKFKAKEFTHFVIGGAESFKFFSGGGGDIIKFMTQEEHSGGNAMN